MSKMIQIRNVPDVLHRRLKSKANSQGLSLSDFLRREIGRLAEQPMPKGWPKRLATRTRVTYRVSPALILREQRGI
jgi:plasmid stability protein